MEQKCNPFAPAFVKICSLLSFLLFASLFTTAQAQVRVTGTVIDAQGKALEGVTVTVKGTQTSTATDASGAYAITVPGPNSVLVFSSVGYGTSEETVGSRTSI